VETDRTLQAVSLFGARLRGHGSDFDTPALRAWLESEAHAEVPPPVGEPGWRAQARRVDRRLPAPARRIARGLARRVGARVRA
jgi:hypothetical protein